MRLPRWPQLPRHRGAALNPLNIFKEGGRSLEATPRRLLSSPAPSTQRTMMETMLHAQTTAEQASRAA